MNNWNMRLPGAETWGPYLEQSPVPPAAFAENPWEALRSFLPESLPSALHTAASGYAAVLTFLVLGAVIVGTYRYNGSRCPVCGHYNYERKGREYHCRLCGFDHYDM